MVPLEKTISMPSESSPERRVLAVPYMESFDAGALIPDVHRPYMACTGQQSAGNRIP